MPDDDRPEYMSQIQFQPQVDLDDLEFWDDHDSPLDHRIDMYSFYVATSNEMQNIFENLGATPCPIGVDVSASLVPHSRDIDSRDGMSED
eukprot:6737773-Karenia_brevis.AAC.1